MRAQARVMFACSSLATADAEIGAVPMNIEPRRQASAMLVQGTLDPQADFRSLECSGLIGRRQDLAGRRPSGRAAQTACRR